MPCLTPKERLTLELKARELCETMTNAPTGIATGLDFAALYVAAQAMAVGFRTCVADPLLAELDEAADELAAERLGALGRSTAGLQ
jgi:hypothetical protein